MTKEGFKVVDGIMAAYQGDKNWREKIGRWA
jgi:hypothetical protein